MIEVVVFAVSLLSAVLAIALLCERKLRLALAVLLRRLWIIENSEMRMIWMATCVVIVLGCESCDERIVNFAERAVESQQRQNVLIARQSEQVALESRDLAVAAKEVVTADAQARQPDYA